MNKDEIKIAKKLRENLKNILENEYSVKVLEASILDHGKNIKTPYWELTNTNEHCCPRDTFSIIGNTILEAPMSWKCRYFESLIYHEPLLKIWNANKNTRWIQPPKPLMCNNLYNLDYPINLEERKNYHIPMLKETEPVFDAADIIRCGKDLFVQNGFTTNSSGIDWITREFGNDFRVHKVKLDNNITPVHLDAEMAILRPGLMLTCSERKIDNKLIENITNEDNDWEIL